MKKISYFLVFVLLFGIVGLAAAQDNEGSSENTGEVFCTQDVRQCSDGSYVSRTGPKCEFKACPSSRVIVIPEIKAELKRNVPVRLDPTSTTIEGGIIKNDFIDQQKREAEIIAERQKRAIEEGGTTEVIKEKKGVWGVINNITNPAKPAPDWKKQEAEWEAAKAKQAEENRQGLENSKNTPVYEILPDGTQRQVSGPVQAEKRSFLDILKGNPEKFQQEAERKLEALPAEAQARIESIKQEFEAKREEAKASFETQKEVLKEKISAIKDQKKQETVSRLNENINELNKKKTEEFSKVVARLEGIWASIQNKATRAAANGAEVGFISEAQSQVDSLFSAAKDSLNQQTGKSYELNITTEDNLKTDIGQVRQTLESDLKAVREKIGAIKDMLYREANQLNQVSAPSVETTQ